MAWQDRDYNRQPMGFNFGRQATATSVTMWLLGINCAVYLLDTVFTDSMRLNALSLSKIGAFEIGKAVYGLQLWRWFTYQFLHADFFHLLFNMIGLYFFGRLMEGWWGSRRFLAFYLLCGMSGAVLFTIIGLVAPSLIFGTNEIALFSQMVGASGSIFGILVGCALLYPHMRVMLMFPPIPMTMRTMALLFLGIAFLSLVAGARNAGGEASHLGGAALGFLLVKNPTWLRFAEKGPHSFGNIAGHWQQRKLQRNRAQQMRDEAEVDRILETVRKKGLHRLNSREKKILKRATDRQRQVG